MTEKAALQALRRLPPPPESVTYQDFLSTFGACEMEVAARKIVEKAAKQGRVWTIRLSVHEFVGDDLALTGFQMLIGYHWLIYSLDGGWILHPAFVKRFQQYVQVDPQRRHLIPVRKRKR